MRSSISSSEADAAPEADPHRGGEISRRLGVVIALGRATWWQLLLTVTLVFVVGEAYMRLPFVARQLEYGPDREFGGRLAPDQRGFVWLASMSLQSPTITLNHDGHRGRDTNWSKPVVLVVGDSEWFGAGVGDDRVWTRVLEGELRRRPGLRELQVVNACHPGDGAYHELMVARRVLGEHAVLAIIARISIGQRNFKAIAPADRARRFEQAQVRYRIRRLTKFIPFLSNKLEAQWASIREAFIPHIFRRPDRGSDWRTAVVGEEMWLETQAWWEQIVALGTSRGIPVVFVVHDVEGTPATGVLLAHVEGLAGQHQGVHVSRLGPDRFGLDREKGETFRGVVRDKLTLGRDPHGNALQHALVAQAILADAERGGLVEQLRARLGARSGR
jgi:hypothetical protein